MKTEWSRSKARSNLLKHGVDFCDAAVALEDEHALTIEDRDFDEHRFKTLALGPDLKVLMIVFTLSDPDIVRIISARPADPKESRQYFNGITHE